MSLLEKQRIVEAYEKTILKEMGFDVDTDKKMKDCMDKNAPKMGFDAANRKCSEQVKVTAEAEFDVDTDQKYKDCMDKNTAKMGNADAHVYCMEQMNVTVEGEEGEEEEGYEEEGKKKKKKKKTKKDDEEEDEDISEFLKLKPEFAKKKAAENLKRIADDIKDAIKKHGEDSKVVLYLRAKKKRMAGAMAEALDEAQMKKAYGGVKLKERMHYGMDLSELINLVRHITFEEITRPKNIGPADPKNQTQYNKVFTGVMKEVETQFKTREAVSLKTIKKILPEIVTDSLTTPKVK